MLSGCRSFIRSLFGSSVSRVALQNTKNNKGVVPTVYPSSSLHVILRSDKTKKIVKNQRGKTVARKERKKGQARKNAVRVKCGAQSVMQAKENGGDWLVGHLSEDRASFPMLRPHGASYNMLVVVSGRCTTSISVPTKKNCSTLLRVLKVIARRRCCE